MRTAILLALLLCTKCICLAQVDKDTQFEWEVEKLAISTAQIGHALSVQDESASDYVKIRAIYCGQIVSKAGKLKMVYLEKLVGNKADTRHGNSRLVIYQNGKRLGAYELGGIVKPPPMVAGDRLVFRDRLSCNLNTSISLRDSVPQQIFIHCTKDNGQVLGDVYELVR